MRPLILLHTRFTLKLLMSLVTGLLLGVGQPASATANFSVVVMDASNTGFNDPTAFTAMGGNAATTLGQARLNVLNEAGRIWGQRINSSQTIVIEARFLSQGCSAGSAMLAGASPKSLFTLPSRPNVLLPSALADALNNQNNGNDNDIVVQINGDINGSLNCLGGHGFYLGLDHNAGNNIDLLNVLLHELGHGLGFISLTDSFGALPSGFNGKFGAFDQFIYSEALGKFWPQMTDAERKTAATNTGFLTFNGTNVNAQLGFLSAGLSMTGGRLRLYAPATYQDGSSVSHWDPVATPNLLMEPFINSTLTGQTDLTGCVLRDIGWSGARCPDNGQNIAPVANPQTLSTQLNSALTLTLSGSDNEGSALSFTVVTSPTHGVLSGTAPNLVYTAESGYLGDDAFTFVANDGALDSALATISISVVAPPPPPAPIQRSNSSGTGTTKFIWLLALALLCAIRAVRCPSARH